MNYYDFSYIFNFNIEKNIEMYLDALYEAGCGDAIVGMGQKGSIVLDFMRESESAYQAVYSAIQQVKSVIPTAFLIQVSPDLVGVLELSEILECSKQNVQKYINKDTFPNSFFKSHQAIWHLDEVLEWFWIKNEKKVDFKLLEIAKLSRNINLTLETKKANDQILKQAQELVAI
ncbi:DNA-binding protein [Geminocystis sp. GBBB08]|uniref:DNA-binding protein n=1 Tax=Geminocystis sp. GBBB08 TaxID=2604140 RepID=UPI0027E25CE0|nr:DNA-binding protein [Geminocystis sp. GBBB08]MBL1208401.1 DNA-binding protein [Geminocystis sp. GBBB08]